MASTLITTTDMAEHIETELTDTELERLIDSADSAIRDVYGDHGTGQRTIYVDNLNRSKMIFVPYPPASSVGEVSHYRATETASQAVTVPASEYETRNGGTIIVRPAKRFSERVRIRYTPVDHTSERLHILIDLVRLSSVYSAVSEEESGAGRSGGSTTTYLDYKKEWDRILYRMRPLSLGYA